MYISSLRGNLNTFDFLTGYGSVPGMNDQPPPYEAASVPTKGH